MTRRARRPPAAALGASRRCSAALRAAVLGAFVLPGPADAQPATARGTTAFVHVSVVPMDRERVLRDQLVVVRGGRIVSVGPGTARPPEGALVIDGRGKYLVPGLADLHVHLAYDRATNEELLRLFLASGVTAVLNLKGNPDHLALRADVARGAVVGPLVFTAGPYVNEPFVTTPEEVERAVVAQRRAGYDFVKMHGNLSREAYARLMRVARREGIRVVGHSPRNLGFEAMFAERQYAVVHAEEFIYDRMGSSRDFATLEPRIPEIARAAAAARLWVMPNLTAFRNIGGQLGNLDSMLARPEMATMPAAIRASWGPETNPYLQRLGRRQHGPIMERYAFLERLTRGFRDAGVRLVLGTDALNTGTVPGTSAHDELALLVDAGLTPYEALRAATANAADFLGGADRAGVVTAGRRADLLLLDANPLERIENTRRIAGVMVRGRWMPKEQP